jgi:hypothetical protein
VLTAAEVVESDNAEVAGEAEPLPEPPAPVVVEPDPPQAAPNNAVKAARTGNEARMYPFSGSAGQDPAGARLRPLRGSRGRATIQAMATGVKSGPSSESLRGRLERVDPFWAPQLVAAGPILLDLALSRRVTLRPVWLLPALEGLVLIALIAASPHPRMRHTPLRRRLSIGLIGLVSVVNSISLIALCHLLLSGQHTGGRALIGSGMLLWVTNVLLFGLWYWQLDRGGPVARAAEPQPLPDFLFPQMTDPRYAPADWSPGLTDYLYTSFTNATAFSPTDTMPLTATAKWLMTAQSLTALVTIGLVVARAVNILN